MLQSFLYYQVNIYYPYTLICNIKFIQLQNMYVRNLGVCVKSYVKLVSFNLTSGLLSFNSKYGYLSSVYTVPTSYIFHILHTYFTYLVCLVSTCPVSKLPQKSNQNLTYSDFNNHRSYRTLIMFVTENNRARVNMKYPCWKFSYQP